MSKSAASPLNPGSFWNYVNEDLLFLFIFWRSKPSFLEYKVYVFSIEHKSLALKSSLFHSCMYTYISVLVYETW